MLVTVLADEYLVNSLGDRVGLDALISEKMLTEGSESHVCSSCVSSSSGLGQCDTELACEFEFTTAI